MAHLSSRSVRQPRKDYFPLMQLPLELRRIIYREILTPNGPICHPGTLDDWEERSVRYAATDRDSKQRANFLMAGKQINAEASAVWYDEHIVKARFGGRTQIDGDSAAWYRVMRMPAYLPKIRNPEIGFRSRLLYRLLRVHNPDFNDIVTIKDFARFCHELAVQCHSLRDVSIEIPCLCSLSEFEYDMLLVQRDLTPDPEPDLTCLAADGLELLLKPLERLRVSRRFELKSQCKHLEHHLQPVFDRLKSVVQSRELVNELEGTEKIWWDLYDRAKPYIIEARRDTYQSPDPDLGFALHSVHLAADIRMSMDWYPIYPEETARPGLNLEESQSLSAAIITDHFMEKVQRVEEMIEKRVMQITPATSAKAEVARAKKSAASSTGRKRKADAMGPDEHGRNPGWRECPRLRPRISGAELKNLEIDMKW